MTFIKEDDDDDDGEANSSVTNMRSKPNLAYARVKIRDVSRLNSQICHGDKINGMYSGEKKRFSETQRISYILRSCSLSYSTCTASSGSQTCFFKAFFLTTNKRNGIKICLQICCDNI